MKKSGLLIMALMWGSTFLLAQQNQVPLETITEIANKNAKALWGNVYPDEPIPYYSAQDEIIAYRFNYAIGNPFPPKIQIAELCETAERANKKKEQWGVGQYGQILMSARKDLPPVLTYSNSISSEYAQHHLLENFAKDFLGQGFQFVKIYYLNDLDQWFQYNNGDNSIYIRLKPPEKIADQYEFDKIKSNCKKIAQEKDFTGKWDNYIAGKTSDSKASHFVPNPELCRKYDWSYGCTPTSAAMLFSWWDYRSLISGNDYANLIHYYFQRWDCIQNEMDYQVPGVQKTLAIEMETDTSCSGGSTWSYNCDNGIQDAASIQGYDIDADNRYTSKWYHIEQQIDANRPLLVHSATHTYCALGYNDSDETIFTHTTWDNPAQQWISEGILECITRVEPQSDYGQGITLTFPMGDTNYNATGNGEIFYPGEYYGISWEFETSITSSNIIYYSTNGSGQVAEEVIVYDTPNDGYFAWFVPTGIGSDLCRIGINNYNAGNDLLGVDCSMGMFTIYDPPDIEELGSYADDTDYNPDYFQYDQEDNAWCAVGIRNMFGTDWKLKLYDDLTFLTLLEESNIASEISEVEFVVFDGNHLADHTYGIKVDRLEGDGGGKILCDDSDYSVSLGTQSIYFPESSVIKMYDAHLSPGYYTFTLSSGSGEASMALFSSTSGDYMQNLDDAMALGNTGGYGESETFTVCITIEDDYGFCVWTSSPSSQTWQLDIVEEHPGVWEGDFNSLWSNSNNWSLDIVPSFGTDVTIPAGTQYDPYVTSYSFCNNITIESGATLRVYTANLVAGGDVLVKGNLRIYEDQALSVNGDIIWTSSASEYMGDNSSINVGEDWTFDYGSSIHLANGKVRFAGIEHSMIYCRSEDSWFNEVEVDKLLETALVSYEMTPGLQNLQINGDFNGLVGNFICPSMMSIIFKGQDLNITDDFNFSCSAGSFIFQGDDNQYIYFNPTSNFNNLVIECTGNIYLQDPITIDQNVYINWGILASNSYTIEVGGSWYNSAFAGEFWQSSGIVIFTGYGNRECTGEQFHILELNKTSGELRFPEGVTECDVYNYTQGTIRINGGSFIANDLEDSGIFGTIIISEGNLEYHQDLSKYIDLRGDLTMSGGNFTIYGGGDNSYWPFGTNASITMSDGTLDIVDNGIRIHQTNYSLTENITGGRIRTAYGFDIYRDDFTPAGGVIELYGSIDEFINVSGTSYFHDLQINKSTKNYAPKIYAKKPRNKEQQNSSKSNSIVANSNLDINGDFILSAGTFDAPGKMFVAGNWQNNAGSAAFIEGMDTVYFDGNTDQYCNFEMFYNLILSKSGGALILNADDVFCTNYDWGSGGLFVNGGGFIVSDLVDDGIYGDITLTNGLIEFNQGSTGGEYVDLCGNLTMNGGYMNIIGGSDDSYWPYQQDASITMNGGILDFQTVGIYIYNSPSANFTENISGGTIKTGHGFRGNRADFTPIGGILKLYGTDDAFLGMGPGSNLFNLQVNKSSKGNQIAGTQTESRLGNFKKSSKSNTLTMISDIDIEGYFTMDGSTFEFNNHQAKFSSDVQLINNSHMILNANSTLVLSSISNITMKTGAIFEAIGSIGNEALVTSESGFYNFTVSTGGFIRAEHAIFENMSEDGIYINQGGMIDVAYPFNNCTFRNGENLVGSSLLKINNSQNLSITNASFPNVMPGGPCNVAKLENTGEITFVDPTGLFCGCIYEDDPYDRINWESSIGYNVGLTAYLEGPFDLIGMTTHLNDADLIPLNQPYAAPPWNYPGTESVASIPPNVVDWVLIELRDASDANSANSSRTFAKRAAFLLKNGSIVDLDGTSSLFLNEVFNLQMFAVVLHRNHLGILSANSLTLSGGKYTYDFSSSETQVYGGSLGHKLLAPGYWGLFGGNGAIDNEINESDKINVWSPQSGNTGYLSGDYNLDGQVTNQDKNDVWLPNSGQFSQLPE